MPQCRNMGSGKRVPVPHSCPFLKRIPRDSRILCPNFGEFHFPGSSNPFPNSALYFGQIPGSRKYPSRPAGNTAGARFRVMVSSSSGRRNKINEADAICKAELTWYQGRKTCWTFPYVVMNLNCKPKSIKYEYGTKRCYEVKMHCHSQCFFFECVTDSKGRFGKKKLKCVQGR